MKILFVVAVAVYYLDVSLANINVYHLNNQLLTSIPTSDRRSKRASGKNETDNCVQACLKQMQENVKKNLPNTTIAGKSVNVNLKPEDVSVLCPKVYQPVNTCISKCSNDDVKFYVTTGFTPLKYICVDNYEGAKKDYPCASKVSTTNKQKCEEPCSKASNQTTAVTATHNSTSSSNDTTVILSLNCKQNKCVVECQTPLIKKECGDGGVKFVKGLAKSGMDAAEKIATKASGKPIDWPKECKEFLAVVS